MSKYFPKKGRRLPALAEGRTGSTCKNPLPPLSTDCLSDSQPAIFIAPGVSGFNEHLKRIKSRKKLMERKFPMKGIGTQADSFTDVAMTFFWEWIFDEMLKVNTTEEKAKLGAMAAKLYELVTARRAVEVKLETANKGSKDEAPKEIQLPTDKDTFETLEKKLNIF